MRAIDRKAVEPLQVVYIALSWAVTLLVPVALVLAVVRLLITPAFVRFEYSTPGFPADPFGFTREERLTWSRYAVDYLVNDEGISYLGDLRFDDGTPVFNQRELRHMVDVKITVQRAMAVWYAALTVLVVLGIWSWGAGWFQQYLNGLRRGGWLTVYLLGAIILFVLVSFGVIFVYFHEIFFEPGTWTFFHSDTLIRLFPERFWRDIFLIVGLLSLAGGLVLALGLRSRRE